MICVRDAFNHVALITAPIMYRLRLFGALSVLTLTACSWAHESSHTPAQEQRAKRIRVLDSLAAALPCRDDRYRVLAPPTWTRAHACAVAARGVQLLAAAAPHEPELSPGDTARIRAVTVWRIQTCEIMLDSPTVAGKVTPVWYMINIDVPQRPRFIAVAIDASTLLSDDGVATVHKDFSGSDTLPVVKTESADTLEIGSPCMVG